MSSKIPSVTLSDGSIMPGFAFGTYKATENTCKQAVKDAIDAGYRHIDTATLYLNEVEVGEAIREKISEGVIKREDIYLVTKLWSTHHERVLEACEVSFNKLNVGYIDLYLIHAPLSMRYDDEKTLIPMLADGKMDVIEVDHLKIWADMEKCVEKGWVKSIGMSNFNSQQVKDIVDNSKIKPVCNQVECSPFANQRKLAKFCKEIGVVVTGYSPFGQTIKPEENKPSYLFDAKVAEIGKKYGKTAAQVVLRFSVELGVIPIAKSATKSRIIENSQIFDFKLTQEEIEYLDSFNDFKQRVVQMNNYEHCKYYAFGIEF